MNFLNFISKKNFIYLKFKIRTDKEKKEKIKNETN